MAAKNRIDFSLYNTGNNQLRYLHDFEYTLEELVANNRKVDWKVISRHLKIKNIEDLDKVIDYINIYDFLYQSFYMLKIDRVMLQIYIENLIKTKPYIFKKFEGSISMYYFTLKLMSKSDARFYPKFLEHFSDTWACDWVYISSKRVIPFEVIEKYKQKIQWRFFISYRTITSDFVFENRHLIKPKVHSFSNFLEKFIFTDEQLEQLIKENSIKWSFIFSKYEKDKEFFIQNFTKLMEEKGTKNAYTVLRYVKPETLAKFIDRDIMLLLKLY